MHTLHLMKEQVERHVYMSGHLQRHPDQIKKIPTQQDVINETVNVTVKDVVNTVVDRDVALAVCDTVAHTTSTEWTYDLLSDTFEDFVPPPAPLEMDPAATQTKQEEQENNLRRQIYQVDARFNASEEERKRVWRKLQKVRSDFDPKIAAHQQHVQAQSTSSASISASRARVSSGAASSHVPASTVQSTARPTATTTTMTTPVAAAPPSMAAASAPTVAATAAVAPAPATYTYVPPTMATTSTAYETQQGRGQEVAASEAHESLEASAQPKSTGTGQVKPGDKYGGKYSVEKVRERIFPGMSVSCKPMDMLPFFLMFIRFAQPILSPVRP